MIYYIVAQFNALLHDFIVSNNRLIYCMIYYIVAQLTLSFIDGRNLLTSPVGIKFTNYNCDRAPLTQVDVYI
jgi:hypothetical protein